MYLKFLAKLLHGLWNTGLAQKLDNPHVIIARKYQISSYRRGEIIIRKVSTELNG